MSEDTLEIMMMSGKLEELLYGEKGLIESRSMLPWLTLLPDFSIQPLFPSTGAALRFRVRNRQNPKKVVSVYLDTREILGYFGDKAYWEAYPINDNNERWAFGDVQSMLTAITKELRGESLFAGLAHKLKKLFIGEENEK